MSGDLLGLSLIRSHASSPVFVFPGLSGGFTSPPDGSAVKSFDAVLEEGSSKLFAVMVSRKGKAFLLRHGQTHLLYEGPELAPACNIRISPERDLAWIANQQGVFLNIELRVGGAVSLEVPPLMGMSSG